MALKIEPQSILFRGAFLEPMTVTVKLSNTITKRLAYKVLTTSQDYYQVRNVKGFIEPQGEKVIEVRLEAIGDPKAVAGLGKFNRNKQKVLIKAAPTNDDGNDPEKINNILTDTPKNKLFEMKLPIIFMEEPTSIVQVQQSKDDLPYTMSSMANTNANKPEPDAVQASFKADTSYTGYGTEKDKLYFQEDAGRQFNQLQSDTEQARTAKELDDLLDSPTFQLIMLSLLAFAGILNFILS